MVLVVEFVAAVLVVELVAAVLVIELVVVVLVVESAAVVLAAEFAVGAPVQVAVEAFARVVALPVESTASAGWTGWVLY